MPRHRHRERREERAALLGREVQVVDQQHRRALAPRGCASPWTKHVWSESFVSGSTPGGVGSPRSSASNAGTSERRLRQRTRPPLSVAEVLAERRAERARRRRRAARRVAPEEEVQVLARRAGDGRRTRRRAALADPRLALDQDDLPVARLRLLEERAQLRDLRLASVDRRLPRDPDAPQRALRDARGSPSRAPSTTPTPRPPRGRARSALASAKRSSGFFARRQCTTSSKKGESCGLTSPRRRGSSWRIRCRICGMSSARYGLAPQESS